MREYKLGDRVLVLKPKPKHKLDLAWDGPYTIAQKVSNVNYLVTINAEGEQCKLYHVNMLKPYFDRGNLVLLARTSEGNEYNLSGWGKINSGSTVGEVKLAPSLTQEQVTQLKVILMQFQTIFSNLPGKTNLYQHRIDTGEASPIAVPPYRVTGPNAAHIKREVEEMLDLGLIVPSESAWAAPVVLVPKPDNTLRFCVDYRRLNKVTTPDVYPMLRIDELVETIGAANYITTLDLRKGYWQVAMSPADQHKTAIVTKEGLFEFTVLPFGLRNAPSSFQRLIDKMLMGLRDFSLAYLDDIAIFSPNWRDHIRHIATVFQRIKDSGLTVKAAKCQFAMTQVKYLGHVIGGGNIRANWGKVQAITDWPRPSSKKEVRAFLGVVGYYRRHIPSFSTVAAPLCECLKKKNSDPIIWSPECQEAFNKLKRVLTTEPILKLIWARRNR